MRPGTKIEILEGNSVIATGEATNGAGFVRVGVVRKTGRANGAYATRKRVSAETEAKSRYSEPVYYVFDNRGRNSRATSSG